MQEPQKVADLIMEAAKGKVRGLFEKLDSAAVNG